MENEFYNGLFTFEMKINELAGAPYCSPAVVSNLYDWYKEARDLAREALNFVGSHDSDEYKKMVEKLKNLDSRTVL